MVTDGPAGNKLQEIRSRLQAQAEEAARQEAALLTRDEPRVEPVPPSFRKAIAFAVIGVIAAASWTTLSFYLSYRRMTRLEPAAGALDLRANSITSPDSKRLLDLALERVRTDLAAHPEQFPKPRGNAGIAVGDRGTTPTAGGK